jgi:formate dehydrogenase subunit gamma
MSVGEMENVSATGRVKRHLLIDRVYHWVMAICVLILLTTAFLPIIGIKFEWLDLHWITGVVLSVLVLIHIVRALFWQDFWAMMIGARDIRDGWRIVTGALGGPGPGLPAKYSVPQKLYHAAIAVLVLSIVGSGLLMLLKIDTPFWRRNPYWFADYAWGMIYALHDFAAMALLSMVMLHIYFALRPDEWHLTRSMFRGWITPRELDKHFDRQRWAGEK